MPRKIVLTAEHEQQFRVMWVAGVPVADMCETFGLAADAVNRLRARFGLTARTARTRAPRRQPPRDPTPAEIAAACAALRDKHLARRIAEPPGRKYRADTDCGGRVYRCDVFDADE